MRILAAAAVAAAMLAGPAMAADAMSSVYGNTVVITYPDGTEVKLFIDEGGAYTGSSPMGQMAGTWKVENGQTCFTQTAPTAGEPSCSATVSKNVGDSWDGVGQGGAPVKIKIVEGR